MNTSFETKTNNDEWLTPPYIFEALAPFDLDVCEPIAPPWRIAPRGFNINDDGLHSDWGGVFYMVQSALWPPNKIVAQEDAISQQRNCFGFC